MEAMLSTWPVSLESWPTPMSATLNGWHPKTPLMIEAFDGATSVIHRGTVLCHRDGATIFREAKRFFSLQELGKTASNIAKCMKHLPGGCSTPSSWRQQFLTGRSRPQIFCNWPKPQEFFMWKEINGDEVQQ